MDKIYSPVLGTAQLGMDYGIANTRGVPDFDQAFSLIDFAIKNGIHTFDTAQAYGKSEALLGQILSKLKPCTPIKLITKINSDVDHSDLDKMKASLQSSLEKLQQKNIYGLMLHDEHLLSLWDKGLKAVLLSFKQEGLVEKTGISLYSPETALDCLDTDGIDMIQIPSSILDRRFDRAGIFKKARDKNKTIFVRSIFLQGLLLMDPDKLPSHMNYAARALKYFKTLSTKMNLTRKQLAIGYAKHAFDNAHIIFGAEALDQLKENISLWNHSFPQKKILSIKNTELKIDKRVLDPSKWGKTSILAILQARMSSSRLPGKVMKTILGKPMLELQIERLSRSTRIEKLVVATSSNKEDDPIETLCRKLGVACFRGCLDNVLDRFYRAATLYSPENIVRLTGDCPLCDHEKIDDLIDFFMELDIDYASNCKHPKLPDGLDAEILTFNALKKTWQNATLDSEKEHVTLYIENNHTLFKTNHLSCKKDYSHMRWTVDEPEDFMFVKKIYESLYPDNPYFTTRDIISFLKANPDVCKINSMFERNQGYQNPADNFT